MKVEKDICGMSTVNALRHQPRRVNVRWSFAPLAEVCRFLGGGTPPKTDARYWVGDIPWVSPKDMKSERLSGASEHISKEAVEESSTAVAPAGSILVLVRGMGLAKGLPVCLLDAPCAFNQDIRAIIPGERLSAEFLSWVLRAHAPQILECRDMVTHGTLKLDMSILERWEVPVPPWPEQETLATQMSKEMAEVR